MTRRFTPSVVLCCGLALAGPCSAQTAEGAQSRGIFMATVVSLIAQGIGNGLGIAASDGIVGSIKGWFNREPKEAQPADAEPSAAAAAAFAATPAVAPQAGIAYEVHLIGHDRESRAVDPARHVFRTGDRFQVFYRPTLPGRVQVANVNPRGEETRIDALEVAAGQLAALGPYQFVGAKGEETLKLTLEPCSSATLTAATRAIVKVGAPSAVLPTPAVQIADCTDPLSRSARAKARAIGKTTRDGATAFALDPLSRDEVRTGRIGAREIQIALKHQ